MTITGNSYSNYLSGITTRNGLLDGFMSLFNLFDDFESILSFGSRQDDYNNITSDWQRIGNDICTASKKFNEKSSKAMKA